MFMQIPIVLWDLVNVGIQIPIVLWDLVLVE